MHLKSFLALLCYVLVSTAALSAADQLVISEFAAVNNGPLRDSDGELSDWIEIRNTGTNTVNLNGWYLTDAAANLTQWRFPSTNIGPNGYLVVFASSKDRRTPGRELHTNFRLNSDGEYLALVQPDGVTVASAYSPNYAQQVGGLTYGLSVQQTVTTLLSTGAVGRLLIPTNDALGQTWVTTDFDDSSWTLAVTGIGFETDSGPADIVVADSVADWSTSGTQGEKNWFYGYYNRSADSGGIYAPSDFTQFPRNSGPSGVNNYWTGVMWDWFAGNPPWDEIGQTGCHPNGINNGAEHWVIRRWVSKAAGRITVDWTVRKTNPGGAGVTGRVFLNGVQQDSAVIAGTDTTGVNRSVVITNVNVGDFVDIALDPTGVGGDTGDGADGSAMTAVVRATANLTGSIASNIETSMRNVNSTAYIRLPFNVTNSASINFLTLRMQYDDGFIARLNGIDIAVRNQPVFPDVFTWNSAATTNRFDGEVNGWEEIDITPYAGYLRDGVNVLAIHGLNASAGDSDFLILPEIRATAVSSNATLAYFSTPTPGSANAVGSTNIGPIIANVSHAPNTPQDNEDLYVSAKISPTFHSISNVLLIYRVMFSNEVTTPMIDDGAHGDGAAGDGVYGAIIPASAASRGQMIRYYVSARDVRTNLMRQPAYQTPTGSPQYFGTIVHVDQTNGLPLFHLFIPEATLNAANNDSAGRYPCSVYYLGEFYDNCGINRHGQSSAGFPKKSYDIDFNPGHNFKWKEGEDRVDDINLLTTYPDKSHMRNLLAYGSTFKEAGSPYHYVEPIRVHTNGGFYGDWHMVENGDENYLERIGRNPNGSLYKMYNTFTDPSDYTISSAEAEKKTRKQEGNADLVALFNGVNNASLAVRTNFMYDNIDIAEVLNSLAARSVTSDWDCCHKNYYFYRDSEGTGEWQSFPWDIDLSFGRNWSSSQSYWDDAVYPGNRIWGNWDNNAFFQLVLNMPAGRGIDATRQMYLRRVRTLMDELLQTNGTPAAQLHYEKRIDELTPILAPDAALDLAKWGTWGGGSAGPVPLNSPFYRTVPQAAAEMKTNYLPARRNFVFNQLMGLSGGDLVNFGSPQPTNVVILIGAIEYNPASANQAEEYIQLINTNRIAVDISGWTLSGGIRHTFQGGVVIPSSNSVYVVADKKAFRARTTGLRGGMGLYIEGGYEGQLSARGETLTLTDKRGRLVTTNRFIGSPSLAQQYLRITEIMYNPAPPPAGSPYNNEDFEYIELKNIGPVSINLAGVHFTNGVEFAFGNVNLAAGGVIILAKNPAAFASRYPGVNVAGTFLGSLDNAGEAIRLDDAVNEKILDFSYNNSWYPMTDGNGLSLVIVNENAPFNTWGDKVSWRPSNTSDGTPGSGDAPPLSFASILVNEVLSHTDLPTVDAVELYNPTTNDVNIGNWLISDDFNTPRKYRIPAGTIIAAGGYRVFDELQFNQGVTAFSFSSEGDEVFLFSGDSAGNPNGYFHGFEFGAAENGVSFGRYTNSQGEIHFVAQGSNTLNAANALPKVGPVIISEIMYHPADIATTTNLLDNTLDEFVELQNLTTNAVALFDPAFPTNRWKLQDAVEFQFSTSEVLPANGFIVVVSFDPATNATLVANFRSKYGIAPTVRVVGPYAGKLDNSGESVELYRPDAPSPGNVPYILMDRVQYSDVTPWDVIADGFGASLHRMTARGYGNDPTNWIGASASPGAAFVGGSAPVITQQPANASQFVAGTTNFTAVTSGSDVRYQWFYNSNVIAGATSATLTLTNIQFAQAGAYHFVAYNGGGSVVSAPARLTVIVPVYFSVQPASQNVQPGTNVTISAMAIGNGPVRYQWYFQGNPIPGATNSSYSFTGANLNDHHGNFTVVATDDLSSVTSSNAEIYVMVRIGIVTHLQNLTVLQGGTATFTVGATGAPPIWYRWIRGGAAFLTNQNPTLTVTNVQVGTTYRVGVTNRATPAGAFSLTAGSVILTVLADADRDGMADIWETNYFGTASTNTAANALVDADGDGMINRDEYVAGTNPTNALSLLNIVLSATNATQLQFVAQSNITYSVQMRTNLSSGNWSSITNVSGQSGVRTIEVNSATAPASEQRFFRIITPQSP